MRPKHRYKPMEGFAPVVKAREGRLYFGPIFATRQEAQDWCLHIIIDNAERGGPLAEATLRPFKGMVSTLEIEPDPRHKG